ncbi:MAG: hypothetical protein FVQ81_03815 [Candidatus Glassbacteria bacterium]|nr:hypothetical protein [Candidatus Glassbacteria bacterium]
MLSACGECRLNLLDRFNTVFFRTYTYRILENFWELALELLPYLCAGIVVIALLQRLIFRLPKIAILRAGTTAAIAVATLAGMAAPLPVYLAVPFSAVLLSTGIPASPVISFLVACPLIDPNLFLLTYGAFGPAMACGRALSAFCLGAGAGLIYRKIEGRFPLRTVDSLTDSAPRSFGKPFALSLRRQSWFILKIFSVSLLLGAAIKALVPPELVRSLFSDSGYSAILIAIALGVPFYQCGGASIPIMEALNELGLSSGAVLAFFISGPATKISALYAFREGFGSRTVAVYLAYTMAGAFLAGLAFNLLH